MFRGGNEGMSTIPGFNQIQFEGFCRFIDQGLTKELYKFPKIEDTNQEIEFQLYVETYQLVEPLIKERDVVYESLTHSSELYVSKFNVGSLEPYKPIPRTPSKRKMEPPTVDKINFVAEYRCSPPPPPHK